MMDLIAAILLLTYTILILSKGHDKIPLWV
jgi:hypothetical protein